MADPEWIWLQILMFIPSLCVVVINLVLATAVRYFTKFEKYPTDTKYNTVVAVKITIALMLNSGAVAMVVYWGEWYGIDSLTAEMSNIIIANAVISPFVPYF